MTLLRALLIGSILAGGFLATGSIDHFIAVNEQAERDAKIAAHCQALGLVAVRGKSGLSCPPVWALASPLRMP